MSRARSNFFACFKPVMAGDQPAFNSPVTSDDKSSGRRRMAVKRTFSRAVKAVLSKTSSQVKKIKHRSSSNLSSPSKHEKPINNTKNNNSFFNEEMSRTNSNRSSLFTSTCPSSASSISSNSSSGSKRIKESISLDDLKQINKKNSYKYTNGMCIIFICLVAVVFLGKAFAIVACTSTWLFLAPRSEGVDLQNTGFDSEDHKKRVIMEGLLQRNNRPPWVVVH